METLATSGGGRLCAVRLDPGEDVLGRLAEILERQDIRGGFVTVGIGSLRDTTLGFFDQERYVQRTFREPHELLSMTGSIARYEGKPHIHLHAALGDPEYRVVGGHFHGGTVEVLVELMVQVVPEGFGRVPRGNVLKVLSLHPEKS